MLTSRIFFSIIIFIVYCHFPSTASPHKTKVDSLLSQLNSAKEDTQKVRLLSTISWEFRTIDPPKALQYANEAIRLAESLNYNKGLAAAYNNVGSVNNIQGDYANALKNYFTALKIAEQINDSVQILGCFNNIGMIYYYSHNDASALKFHMKSLKMSEKLKDTIWIARSLTWIGNIWYKKRNKEKALDYYKQSLRIGEKANIMRSVSYNLNNIGSILSENGDYLIALEYHYRFLKVIKETNDNRGIASAYYNIAENLGNLRIPNAFDYLDSALTLANQLGYKELLQQIYLQFSKIYEMQGENIKSLEYYKLSSVIKDSIINENNLKIIAEMQIKYETEKKEQELERQNIVIKKRNYQIALVSVALFLLTVIAVITILFLRARAKRKSSELQQKLLRTQMNPHFIFNALTSIQGSVLEKNTYEAADHISMVASLMRLILDNSKEEWIPFETEIKILNNYLELQQLRYNRVFEYSIKVLPDGDDLRGAYIPPMLAQPFIENAIEHGIVRSCANGFIDVKFDIKEKFIVFSTENWCTQYPSPNRELLTPNPSVPPFERELIVENHKPQAIAITKERLYYLNKGRREKIEFEFTQGEKTRVSFKIPLHHPSSIA